MADKKARAVQSTEAEKIQYMVMLLKESLELKRTELVEAKAELPRLQKRIKEIEASMKRFEKLIQAARS